jgi:hypothetical protein
MGALQSVEKVNILMHNHRERSINGMDLILFACDAVARAILPNFDSKPLQITVKLLTITDKPRIAHVQF